MHKALLYAHTLSGKGSDSWEPLPVHLAAVATRAAEYCGALGATDWGEALGLSHDLGKGASEFQDYLRRSHAANEVASEDAAEERAGSPGRVDHSTFGARYVSNLDRHAGMLLAYCVAGHHTGLPDWTTTDDANRSTLEWRLDPKHTICVAPVPDEKMRIPTMPRFLNDPRLLKSRDDLAFALAFFTRMCFSTLIDADRICTEEFVDKAQAEERALERPGIAELLAGVSAFVQQKQNRAEKSLVNEQRKSVQQQCSAAAEMDPGFFSLQVPTGGGKTLSSLVFALRHAVLKQKRRVIVAIPFTSIIEQTADVYRTSLGDLAERGLVEHHTNVEPEQETRANKLGAENWDAPLVVTTNVQLFESLFAARATPCRKLHNLANSVIVLDEAQTLPVELLQPTLNALRELVDHYGCSVVLCTATQPALEHRHDFHIGLEGVRPIVADASALFEALRRVEVKQAGPLTDAEVVGRLHLEDSVLCIVNTRRHALELYLTAAEQGGEDACFHLSTLMCGAHRRQMLAVIRTRLREKLEPCRVISTQLVEAGVDLDFPVVYRAAAGLDSIAQAAGRCNREGLLPLGMTHVFETPGKVLRGFLEQARQAGSEVMSLPQFRDDPLLPAAVEAYFRQLYWKHRQQWDAKEVMECFRLKASRQPYVFQFREAADRYRIIEEAQVPILVPFREESEKFLDDLQRGYVEFVPQRKLQPYLVSVPRHAHARLLADHAVVEHASGLSLLLRKDLYDARFGLRLEKYGLETLVV